MKANTPCNNTRQNIINLNPHTISNISKNSTTISKWNIIPDYLADEINDRVPNKNFFQELKVEVKNNPTSLKTLQESFLKKAVTLQQLCSYYGAELIQKCIDKYGFELDGTVLLNEDQLNAIMVSAAIQVDRTDLENLYNKISKCSKETTDLDPISGRINTSQFSESLMKEIKDQKSFNDLSHSSLIDLLNYFRKPIFLVEKITLSNYLSLQDSYFTISEKKFGNFNEDQNKIFMADLWILYSLESYDEWKEPKFDTLSENYTEKMRREAQKSTFSSEFIARKIAYLRNGNLNQMLSGKEESKYDSFEGILFPLNIKGSETPALFEIKKSIIEDGFHSLISAPFSNTILSEKLKSLPVFISFKGTSFAEGKNKKDGSDERDANFEGAAINPGKNLWEKEGVPLSQKMIDCINNTFPKFKTSIIFTGHSLGGSDSQYAVTVFLEKFYSENSPIKHKNISDFSVHAFNNPGITRNHSESLFKNYYIQNELQDENLKPLRIYHLHSDHDIVQWAGNYLIGYRHKSLGPIFFNTSVDKTKISTKLKSYLLQFDKPENYTQQSGEITRAHINLVYNHKNSKGEVINRDFVLYTAENERHNTLFKFHVARGDALKMMQKSMEGIANNFNTPTGRLVVIGCTAAVALAAPVSTGIVLATSAAIIFCSWLGSSPKKSQGNIEETKEKKLLKIIKDIHAKLNNNETLDLKDIKMNCEASIELLKLSTSNPHIDLDLDLVNNLILEIAQQLSEKESNDYLPICYNFLNELDTLFEEDYFTDIDSYRNQFNSKIKDSLVGTTNIDESIIDKIIKDEENRIWRSAIFLLSCIFTEKSKVLEFAAKQCIEANIFDKVLNLLPENKAKEIISSLPEEIRPSFLEMEYEIIDLPSDSSKGI